MVLDSLVPAFQEQRQVRKQPGSGSTPTAGQGGAARHIFEDGVHEWKAHTGVKDTEQRPLSDAGERSGRLPRGNLSPGSKLPGEKPDKKAERAFQVGETA